MKGWRECKLGDIAEVQTGPFGSQLHQRDYKAVGTPIITVEHIGDNRIIHSNLPLVGEEDRARLIKYSLKVGDVVFSRVGSVDRCAYVHESENGWMFSGRLLRVRGKKDEIDPRFLSFYFSQESFKETIRMIAVGATMPSINTEILSNVEIHIPPLSEQRAIAGVLSSLDDKIDLLHRQNKTLEGMAEALWRKMFVEDADPKWKKGKLGEIAYFLNGKARPEEVPDGPIPIYGGNGILGYTNRSNFNGESIIIGRVGAYCGSLYIENRPIWISDNALLAKPIKIDCSKYIFYLLKNQDLNSMAEGSSHPLLTQTLLSAIEIDIVPEKEMLLFGLNANMWLAKIDFNDNEIHALCLLRDTLLPKLMSGELKVNV